METGKSHENQALDAWEGGREGRRERRYEHSKYLRRQACAACAYDQVSDHCECGMLRVYDHNYCACVCKFACVCMLQLHSWNCMFACIYWYMHACLPHLEVTVHNQHWKSVLKSKFHSFV